MKTTSRVRQKTAIKSAALQAKNQTLFVPAEFKTIRLRECPVDNPKIDLPVEVVDFWRKHVISAPWFKDEKENLCVFLLNTRHRLTGFELISQGTLDALLAHPREVLRPATINNAAAIIIAHNHPSGEPTPSEADIKVTRDLIRAAQILKIELLDHIIIGDSRAKKPYCSLRELGFFYADTPAKPKVDATDNESLVFDSLTELELATTEASGLLQLLADNMDYQSRSGTEFSGPKVAHFCAGIVELVSRSKERLDNAFNKTFSAFNPKHEEAAS
jgi:DNA repair protein RadC